MGFGTDISREFIAVPDGAKGQLLYKWPDKQIRRWTKAIVDADERAVFVSQGRVVGTLEPGQHSIDATELPFLGDLYDRLTGDKGYDCELFFVSTHEFPDLPFGGPVDAVRDPDTHLVVQLRGYGEFSLRVVDPAAFILQLTGTVDLADPSAVVHWASEQVLKAVRTVVVGHVVNDGWPVLGLAARTQDIETGTAPLVTAALAGYGLQVSRLGNVTVSLTDEDAEQLRNLARDTAYTALAGSFGSYAQGEALIGAGQGMSTGRGAAGEALAVAALGIGSGVVGGLTGTTAATGTAAAAVVTGVAVAAARFCTQCGNPLQPGANFCSSCGRSLTPAPTPAQ
jgi:membrane protease subunit (stomatin/prohibitin family)